MSDLKLRPIRIYYDKKAKQYYVYENSKKHYVGKLKNLTKKEAQLYVMNKLRSKLKLPKVSISKVERPVFRFEPAAKFTVPLQHASEITSTESRDPTLISNLKNASPDAKLAALEKKVLQLKEPLNKQEESELKLLQEDKKIKEEKKLSAKEIAAISKIKPLFTKPPKLPKLPPLANITSAKMLARSNRKKRFFKDISYTGLDSSDFPVFDFWNGPNQSGNLIIQNLENLVRWLWGRSETELRDVVDDGKNSWYIEPTDDKITILRKIFYQLTPERYNELVVNKKIASYFQEDKFPKQRGSGNKLPALYNDEIDDFFSDEKTYPNYGGVISSDQIDQLPKKLPIGFIMNLDKSNEPGSHWVAVYISGDSVEYFDPLANKPTVEFKRDIHKYLESMKVPTMMKFKVNEIKQQNGNSHRCGYHSMRFLDDRFHGIPFPLTSRYGSYNNSKEGESVIKKEFSYI